MTSTIETALATTVAQGTARFHSASSVGWPAWVMCHEGIVDFATRRAIAQLSLRSLRNGGLVGRLLKRPAVTSPVHTLFDGPSASACLDGRWQEPYPTWPSELPRKPMGLAVLDLIRVETVLDVVEVGADQVHGHDAMRYALKLDVDRIRWPKPDRGAGAGVAGQRANTAAGPRSLLSRGAVGTLPDPRPKGLFAADVWIDEIGRLCRLGYRPARGNRGRPNWFSAELWEFGVPPAIDDWRSQPAIDPVTLRFPDSESDVTRIAVRHPLPSVESRH